MYLNGVNFSDDMVDVLYNMLISQFKWELLQHEPIWIQAHSSEAEGLAGGSSRSSFKAVRVRIRAAKENERDY